MAPSNDTILITGGTGFVGSHCILQAIQAGFTVQTTIRSLQRVDDVRQSLRNGGATEAQIKNVKFYEADLTKDDGWEQACTGCGYVLHVASPFPASAPKDENELIVPAREGTLRALRAAKKVGTVKRIVLTSSVAAVVYGQDMKPPGQPFTEEDWTKLDNPKIPVAPYQKSKTIAERAAWDFIEKEGNGMELVVVNPVGIFGPVLSSDVATSLELPMMLLNGKLPGIPNFAVNVVDVRDVADLHLRAMRDPKAAGQRFIATSDDKTVTVRDVVNILKENLPAAETKKLPTRGLPDFLIKFAAIFDGTVALIAPELGKLKAISNAKAKEVLGWQPRSTTEAMLESAASLKKYGLVKV
ncbi:Putative NAD-dependent epimerase/dehydratase, NAD(P)-binding domain superfamily [Septoria linicola]|uniref:NAD-dependent epimerase/dehydratase, NAD(P)-binding domain superfamily n=1 Tax=Septoria linicola TaxID=215465 RepID=A0A9Q9B126_9PEZI|nr:Putative NAD-dependent epimerase/dehydratase, NAD(P)-binding domain superfamily [Septoria linicola]